LLARLGGGQRPDAQDQAEAQHDGHRPELADRQAPHALIAIDEARKSVGVDAPIRVPEVIQTHSVNAGVTPHGAVRDTRQLDQVPERQILGDLTDLLLDDAGVIEQPLFGGRGLPAVFRGAPEDLVGVEHALPGSSEALAERPGCLG
jgi:hypothetical protein